MVIRLKMMILCYALSAIYIPQCLFLYFRSIYPLIPSSHRTHIVSFDLIFFLILFFNSFTFECHFPVSLVAVRNCVFSCLIVHSISSGQFVNSLWLSRFKFLFFFSRCKCSDSVLTFAPPSCLSQYLPVVFLVGFTSSQSKDSFISSPYRLCCS